MGRILDCPRCYKTYKCWTRFRTHLSDKHEIDPGWQDPRGVAEEGEEDSDTESDARGGFRQTEFPTITYESNFIPVFSPSAETATPSTIQRTPSPVSVLTAATTPESSNSNAGPRNYNNQHFASPIRHTPFVPHRNHEPYYDVTKFQRKVPPTRASHSIDLNESPGWQITQDLPDIVGWEMPTTTLSHEELRISNYTVADFQKSTQASTNIKLGQPDTQNPMISVIPPTPIIPAVGNSGERSPQEANKDLLPSISRFRLTPSLSNARSPRGRGALTTRSSSKNSRRQNNRRSVSENPHSQPKEDRTNERQNLYEPTSFDMQSGSLDQHVLNSRQNLYSEDVQKLYGFMYDPASEPYNGSEGSQDMSTEASTSSSQLQPSEHIQPYFFGHPDTNFISAPEHQSILQPQPQPQMHPRQHICPVCSAFGRIWDSEDIAMINRSLSALETGDIWSSLAALDEILVRVRPDYMGPAAFAVWQRQVRGRRGHLE